MELFEWTENFIKFRSAVRMHKVELEIKGNKINVQNKSKEETEIYIVGERLEDIIDYNINSKNKTYFVCLNLKDNVHFLHENWEKIACLEQIYVIFVEPNKNDKWILKPHIHNKITEKETLKEGLLSLHNSLNN